MIKKLMILGSVYYSLIILSACCKPYTYFWNYEKLFIEFDKIYSNVNVQIIPSKTINASSDLMVTNFNFKTLNAFSCEDDEYYLEHKIKFLSICTDKKLSDSLPSNEDISQVIKFNNKNGEEEVSKEDLINMFNQKNYFGTISSEFSFKLDLNTPNLDTVSNFNFIIKLELTNDEIILDSIQNIKVNDFKPNPEFEYLWE